MADEVKIIEDVEIENEEVSKKTLGSADIVIADSIAPDVIPLVPLYDRPLFPKIMAPVVVGKNEQSQALLKAVESASNYVGLILAKSDQQTA